MLRARVSVNRKVSHDPDSAGYAVTLDGEIPHQPDDAEAVLDKVGELFDLAHEALAAEVERYHGPQPPTQPAPSRAPVKAEPPSSDRPASANGTMSQPATAKQLRFLQTLGRRKGLSRDDLGAVVARVLGPAGRPDEMTKREAGRVIDHLADQAPEGSR